MTKVSNGAGTGGPEVGRPWLRLTPYEMACLAWQPFEIALRRQVRAELAKHIRSLQGALEVLDIGGRNSPYTVGLPAKFTVSEMPMESDLQRQLNLGLTPERADRLKRRRSNLAGVAFDDMTHSRFANDSFDGAVAVEVIEHVEEDTLFLRECYRVLRPGGFLLLTTPNGEFVPNRNPDHRRHYTRHQLTSLLSMCFEHVETRYAVVDGFMNRLSLMSWAKRPYAIPISLAARVISGVQSSQAAVAAQSAGTYHLLALARKVP
jgi:SAM-dependent methyltransferase